MNILKMWPKLRWYFRGIPKFPMAVLLLLVLAAIFAGSLVSHNPLQGDARDRNMPPFWQEGGSIDYPLGTDQIGRDILSRVLYGARVSLFIAFLGAFVAGTIGTTIGVVSGFLGGMVDQVLMRITDGWLAFPSIFIAILMSIAFGPGVRNIVIVIGLVLWTRYARVIRGEVLSLRERDFVLLAKTAGVSKIGIMLRHLLPNVLHTAITLSTLQLGIVVVLEASLTFIGVGVPPPAPAWGLMLSEGRLGLMAGYWWQIVFPGVGIILLVMSANMLGDWLRVRFDPRLQQLL
ncbi:ABC transporter permease [Chloroflexota bacterium]